MRTIATPKGMGAARTSTYVPSAGKMLEAVGLCGGGDVTDSCARAVMMIDAWRYRKAKRALPVRAERGVVIDDFGEGELAEVSHRSRTVGTPSVGERNGRSSRAFVPCQPRPVSHGQL